MARFAPRIGVPGLAALCLLLSSVAQAQLVDFTWNPAKVVDVGTIDLSSAAGRSVVGLPDGTGSVWDLVYLKDGRVFHIARSAGSWGTGEPLSPVGVTAKNPQIARTTVALHVVWEDDRAGHPEIWARRYEGGAWTTEECLTLDAVRSAAPSLAGGGSEAFLAWEEGNSGATEVFLRSWNGSIWATPQKVSPDGSAAFDPSVSCWNTSGYTPPVTVAWADNRHGTSEIYMRNLFGGNTWESEVQVAAMAGNCRKPSLQALECCLDYLIGAQQVAFLNDSGGVTNAWSACVSDGQGPYLRQLSTLPARSAAIAGFSFNYSPPTPFGGPIAFDIAAWSEGFGSQPKTVFVESAAGGCGPLDPVMLANAALDGPVAGAVGGNPLAGGLVVWTEQQGTSRRLMAALGTVPGCEEDVVQAPLALLVAPEGIPENTIRIWNDCTGEYIHSSAQAQIRFDAALNGAITWDPAQPHPDTGYINADQSGAYVFHVRGGKCVTSGYAYFYMNGVALWGWQGVRSPDVDGDCLVGESDRAYVQARLGTSDFCADLNGSGLVDAADLAIIDATFGDLCSHLVGVNEQVPAPGFDLQIVSNPAREGATLRLQLGSAGRVSLAIFDVAGRVVRDFRALDLPSGNSVVAWDRLDTAGRSAAPGVYFVVARFDGRTLQRRLILLD